MSVSVTITGPSTACLYCNTEDVAFGPVFDSEYEATDFLEHLQSYGQDARELQNEGLLATAIDIWRTRRDGDLSDTARFGAGV